MCWAEGVTAFNLWDSRYSIKSCVGLRGKGRGAGRSKEEEEESGGRRAWWWRGVGENAVKEEERAKEVRSEGMEGGYDMVKKSVNVKSVKRSEMGTKSSSF